MIKLDTRLKLYRSPYLSKARLFDISSSRLEYAVNNDIFCLKQITTIDHKDRKNYKQDEKIIILTQLQNEASFSFSLV